MKYKFVLASSSPRRSELLSILNIDFEIRTADVEEQLDTTLCFGKMVEQLAIDKGCAVEKFENEIIISADTIVVLDDTIMTKPKDDVDAIAMLTNLSGKSHFVYTGVSIIFGKMIETFHNKTKVVFKELDLDDIKKYVNSYHPLDKAGAYGIQDFASVFVKKIDGDYFNVMGLPLSDLYEKIKKYL